MLSKLTKILLSKMIQNLIEAFWYVDVNYYTHIIEPVVTHHVTAKSIKEFVDADGTVIELF